MSIRGIVTPFAKPIAVCARELCTIPKLKYLEYLRDSARYNGGVTFLSAIDIDGKFVVRLVRGDIVPKFDLTILIKINKYCEHVYITISDTQVR